MHTELKALSIRQPWCRNILFDGKDVENRKWKTNFRGSVLIHAAKTFDGSADEKRHFMAAADHGNEGCDLGGILGIMEIVDCVDRMESPWFHGPYGFVIKKAKPLPFIPCNGALSFFSPKLTETQQSELNMALRKSND